jgi:hypothetical protein
VAPLRPYPTTQVSEKMKEMNQLIEKYKKLKGTKAKENIIASIQKDI